MNLNTFIWTFVRKQRWLFTIIFLLSLVWSMEMLVWPFFLRKFVDVLIQYDHDRSSAWDILKTYLIVGAGFLLFIEGSFRSRDFLQAKAFPKLESDIRMTMFDHVQHHSPKYFNEHFAGSLSNKIADMVSSSSIILRNSLMLFVPALFTCTITVIIFFKINPWMAGVVGLWFSAHLLLSYIFTLKCAHYSHVHGESRSSLIGKIVDSFTNNFVVNLFFRFTHEKKFVAHYQKDERKTNQNAQMYSAKMFTVLSGAFFCEFCLLVGSIIYYWTRGGLTTGEVVQLFYTVWNVGMCMWFITDKAPELFQAFGIAKQALQIMNDPQDILDSPNAKKLHVKKGEIIFEDVSFGYGHRTIFQNKNVHIRPGEKVGLVGYSGAGKSTFVNLILRFFPIEKGRILIDGQDIALCSLESLRHHIALIPQDPILFHRTLEDNIRYGRINATDKEILQASQFAHCHEFIQKCHNGYQTLVGERGTKLSGGEKQRIAISRAMLLKAPILILDEATSSLDSVTEQFIQESLEKLMTNRTTIVVAHRLSTLSKMDRILVFDQGKIIEEGSHQALLKKKGHYAHMWHMQAGGFLPDQPA